jgi:hypothetical protein
MFFRINAVHQGARAARRNTSSGEYRSAYGAAQLRPRAQAENIVGYNIFSTILLLSGFAPPGLALIDRLHYCFRYLKLL